ncbi:uncharacterized protein LOC111388530 [Olea europaea var. sylvestris]|uniref:uncharacterized protein LOC111388530 n=1 Tax=Olea europaea var. sylvestris TaxID=158386 RepID=UPI000C1CF732|nr:uncharacterized protein LOC111388530 [Olea europaea var. sylvestris]
MVFTRSDSMDDMFIPLDLSWHNAQGITNLHHFHLDFFYAIIDLQIQELNDRFSETNSDVLFCIACLFRKIHFLLSTRTRLRSINDLAKKLVLTKKKEVYPLIYKLLTLALILPVGTATVERVFSAMKIVKNQLRNRM